jgi:hypothetical protein
VNAAALDFAAAAAELHSAIQVDAHSEADRAATILGAAETGMRHMRCTLEAVIRDAARSQYESGTALFDLIVGLQQQLVVVLDAKGFAPWVADSVLAEVTSNCVMQYHTSGRFLA